MGLRKVLPVKTGAARIAFQAESEKDFQLDMLIQPAGLTYGDFQRFRSSVTITLGEPIVVADYKAAWEKNQTAAVKTLSREIEARLKKCVAEIHNAEFQPLVGKIAKLYQSKGIGADDLTRIRAIGDVIERLSPKYSYEAEQLERLSLIHI